MTVVDASSPSAALAAPSPASSADEPRCLAYEWLQTDGRGGYAASTPPSCPTRRQHGLLVVPFTGSGKRHVFLSRFDERLEGQPLSVSRYRDLFAPRGDLALESFELAPHPVATYAVVGARLTREVRMVPGHRAVLVRYELLEADGPRELVLRPILPFREADALTVENDAADPTARPVASGRGLAWRLYAGLPALSLTASRPFEYRPDPVWYRGVVFEADRARGYDGREDELAPGFLRATLQPGDAWVLAATVEEPIADPAALWGRCDAKTPPDPSEDPLEARLERAADAFLYRDDAGRPGVIAGFPWFGEWGRDTFLALPGLTLARGRVSECAEVLRGALPFLEHGLLPNIFGKNVAESRYGSADAALWFARAVLLFDRAGGSRRTIEKELRPALESIAEAYLAGEAPGLHVDEEALLHAGGPGLNLTWMDAQTADGPVTPRHGCAVEVCALWYSLLAHLEELTGDKRWSALRRRAKRAFLDRFWLADAPGGPMLADVWREGEVDASVRPNMVLAAALELSPLTRAQRRAVVERARAELVTPRGLRTLSPRDPAYIGRYAGGPEERDSAYHQGTAWPWLFGAYTEASLRAGKPSRKLLAELTALWDGFVVELDRGGLDYVSEVFDGDEPFAPGGTFAQAWNTAEWLRARRMLAEGHA